MGIFAGCFDASGGKHVGLDKGDFKMTPSCFEKRLKVELKDGSDSIWILSEPLVYWSATVGLIEVPRGFETDFASVPRVPIAYRMWGDRAHREAVLHDYLYRSDSKPGLPFMACNGVFLEAMQSRDVPMWIRYPMYSGVCVGGWASYHRRKVGDKL